MQEMVRFLLTVLVVFGLSAPAPAPAQPDGDRIAHRVAPRPLASALDAARAGRWEVAARLAARDGAAAAAVIEWMRLSAGLGEPTQVLAFLAAHPDWPDLDALRRRNEEVMTRAGFDDVLAFYRDYHPRTGTGALNLARAQIARGEAGDAEAGVVLAWRTLDLSADEHDAFVAAHEALLKPHHAARLEMALWRGLRDARQMLPLVDDETRARAEARLKLKGGGDIADADLPKGGATDAGIAYERFARDIDRGRSEAAIKRIMTQSDLPGGLGEPERWAGWRRHLARAEMRAGNAATAYRLAAHHQLVEGSNYADLEWLAGYLALRHLGAPELALDHFQRFRAAVESPISLGRAGYWLGRAQEALGDAEAAQISYAFGGQFQTSFYGLLAAGRAGLAPDPALAGTPPAGGWRQAGFARTPLFTAAVLLHAAGQDRTAERFLVALAGTLDEDGLRRLGLALEEMEAPHLQVMVGKAAAERGIMVPGPYYALHPLREMDLPVPAELALAIARRESEFDASVQSGAGAQGLMQLMPGTASDMARALGLENARGRALTDWRFNARLGAAYLARLVERFDGNVIMVAAGYNAGPGRPLRWIEEMGDPRGGGEEEIVDWIEHIPFRETRNYVMRVAESLPVYRARLGKAPLPVPFGQELSGASLRVLALD